MTDAITAASAAAVSGALQKAARKTGASFDYLYRVALRESALDPSARAPTSSAAGLFQFIEQTWLGAVKKYGAAHGLGRDAAAIAKTAGGVFVVADEQRRKEILDLRFDPEKAAVLAAELARENKAALETALGRAINAAELYAAHFLGAGGARRLLEAGADADAAALLPAAANANRAVFYDGARARTVGEVIESFRKTIGEARDKIADFGEAAAKSLAPALRETASLFSLERAALSSPAGARGAAVAASSRIESVGLSPLLLVVLQALDWRDFGEGE